MRRLVRLLSICILTGLFLALPSSGAASAPKTGSLKGPAGPEAVTGPSLIPGARVASLTEADFVAWSDSPGGTIVVGAGGSACNNSLYSYNSAGGSPSAASDLLAPLTLPAGATLWQVDVYGCATDASWLGYALSDLDPATASWTEVTSAMTPTGPGILQATFSFSSGLTLAAGHQWILDVQGTKYGTGLLGAVYQYTLPTLSYVPMGPVRVFDSRFSRFGGAIATGAPRLVNVKDSIDVITGNVVTTNAIPRGAKAISFTLTITWTVGGGWLAVLPGTSTTVTCSTINWSASGQTLATGGTVALGSGSAERQVTIVAGGAAGANTQAVLDITGYYE